MGYRTPRMRATGLGSAGTGTHHWWVHRVSSVLMIPLTVFSVIVFAQAYGQGHDGLEATYRNTINAIGTALWIGVLFHHLMLGLQVVIEDYVHSKGWRTALLLGNQAFCLVFGFAGVFAVLKIAFSG